MTMTMYRSAAYVHPDQPVEFVFTVDGKAARAAIEWSTIEHLMATSPLGEDQVRAVLHRNGNEVAIALRAHVYAHGVPLSRHLTLAAEEFDVAHPAGAPRSEADAIPDQPAQR